LDLRSRRAGVDPLLDAPGIVGDRDLAAVVAEDAGEVRAGRLDDAQRCFVVDGDAPRA